MAPGSLFVCVKGAHCKTAEKTKIMADVFELC
jgi:hypothetical protein